MKTLCIMLIFLLSFQVNAKDIFGKSKIEKVKIFLTGAQIERTSKVNLKAGRNRLVLEDISAKLDEKSIQVRFKEELKLMSVSTEIDFSIFEGKEGKIGQLNDSLKLIESKIQNLDDVKSAINSEKELLNKNKELGGANANLTVEEIEKAANFYRKRMEKINMELTDIRNEINSLNKKKWMIQAKLDVLNFKESTKSNQIIIILDSEKEQAVNLNIEYFVSGCGWEPNYNLSAKDLSGKITMEYKAKVFNDTGNDWENVEMILSTGNPNLSATFPELSPWYLNYQTYVETKGRAISNKDRGERNYYIPENNMNWDMVVQSNEDKVREIQQEVQTNARYYDNLPKGGEQRQVFLGKKPDKNNVVYRTIEVSHLSTEFEIKDSYSIPSDRNPYLVDIKEHELNCTFEYVAVPKMEKDAFLLAQIPGWESLDLIPGPTRVYFDGTYVGESWIDTRNVEDTLGLSFGRDSKIMVSRELLTEFSNKKVIGNNRKDSYTYEITVKNTRNKAIELDLHDQVPISQDSEISVVVDEISSANKEEETGILTWKVKLGPNESKKYKVSFTLKYPKNKKVQVRSFRTISCPSF
ncbi:MAG: DUF4139 domain-containing protein [Crocinitomicaceae bacterium]